MTVSSERRARNQVIFHEVNERLREIAGLAADLTLFVCECGDPCCSEGIELDTIEYAAVRSMPSWRRPCWWTTPI